MEGVRNELNMGWRKYYISKPVSLYNSSNDFIAGV